MYVILHKRYSVFNWLLSFKTSFIPAWIRTVSGVYIFNFTSRYCSNCFDVVSGKGRCFTFPIFKALLKLYILILPGIFLFFFFRYRVTIRFIIWNYWYFGKCRLIFWMRINYNKMSPFRNVFWILLRIPYCPLKIYIQIIFFTVVNIATKIRTIVCKF